MSNSGNSVRTSPVISDERLRNIVRRELDYAINIVHAVTRRELADASGVNIHTIDALLSRDPAKHRRIALEDAMSLGWVMGERAINAILSVINYVARPVEVEEANVRMMAAEAMGHLAIIAKNAADGHIDHTEEKETREAADMLIATVLPLASAGNPS